MSSPEPPGGRLPIGESPKWIAVHAFIMLGLLLTVALLLRVSPDGLHRWLRELLGAGSLMVLASLARFYVPLRTTMSKVDTGYLRTALFFVSVSGFGGAWYLPIPAGVAFYIWTIVERRRQRKPPTTARERFDEPG